MFREKIAFVDWRFYRRTAFGIAAFILLLAITGDSPAAPQPHSNPAAWQAHAARMEVKYGLPDRLLRAVCEQESHWRNGLRGAAGEIGICQVQVDTVRMLCPACDKGALGQNYFLGSTGSTVARIQSALAEQGYYLGKIDGIFGEGTRTATVLYQQRSALLADGIVGPRTWSALFAEPYPGTPIETVLWNPEQNIEWAAKYLAWLKTTVSDDPAILMAAYNGGSANKVVKYMVSVSKRRVALAQPLLNGAVR